MNEPEVEFEREKVVLNSEIIVGDTDWEKLGQVSPVKNEGNCEASYSFCTIGLAESITIMNKSPLILSDQQMMDCGGAYSAGGCSGGSRSGAIKFLQEKGVQTQAAYPNVQHEQKCMSTESKFKLTNKITEANGCDEIKQSLLKSPLTVAVNTDNWQFYRTGIMDKCGSTVNMDIMLIGVTLDSWRLKNCWGNRWGEYGFIRIALGNTCGVCSKPAYGFTI